MFLALAFVLAVCSVDEVTALRFLPGHVRQMLGGRLYSSQQTSPFVARSTGVRVDVLVTKDGRPLAGLTGRDFELKDQGILQQVDLVETTALPINVLLTLDTSESTSGATLQDLVSAAGALLAALRIDDRAAVTTFDHLVSVPPLFTTDRVNAQKTLSELSASGETAVLDAVFVALMATQREAGRSLVLLFSDGRDTSSWLLPSETLEAAKRSNAIVYAVASSGAKRWRDLAQLTEATGGAVIEVDRSSDIRREFLRILEEFRNRYVLVYQPAGVQRGGFHPISVRVLRNGARVTSRPGYVDDQPRQSQ